MTEYERIKDLTPKFQLAVLDSINHIETMITEIISIEFCKEADDIYKRVNFFNYFEDRFRLQPKIDLLKIILQTNHDKIFEEFSDYFENLAKIQEMRNIIGHNTIAYEQDPTTGEKAKLILHHPRIKRQRKLSEQDMHEYIRESEELTKVTRKMLSMIGKSKNLRL